MTSSYHTPHLNTLPSAYRHHLAQHLTAHWRDLASSAASTALAGSLAWATHNFLDPFWGAVMVGVVLVMLAHWLRDVLAWPIYDAIRSQRWYGPDRIVHRAGVGPVQVVDVDVREGLAGVTWVLVRTIGSPANPASWVVLGDLIPLDEGADR